MQNKIIAFCLVVIFLNISIATGGTINLPQTGQTKCYNTTGTEIPCAGTGQDGALQMGAPWPNPRFTVSGDCVIDNLTGLMWARNANLPNGYRTWQGALDFANSLSLCGYSDWRLPNVNELESLVHADHPNSATWLNAQGFTKVQSYYYWSSSSSANYTNDAWIVSMWNGGVYDFYSKGTTYYVWPVRSGQ